MIIESRDRRFKKRMRLNIVSIFLFKFENYSAFFSLIAVFYGKDWYDMYSATQH